MFFFVTKLRLTMRFLQLVHLKTGHTKLFKIATTPTKENARTPYRSPIFLKTCNDHFSTAICKKAHRKWSTEFLGFLGAHRSQNKLIEFIYCGTIPTHCFVLMVSFDLQKPTRTSNPSKDIVEKMVLPKEGREVPEGPIGKRFKKELELFKFLFILGQRTFKLV